MSKLFEKYKSLVLMLFLGGFISFVDSFVLSGEFKGIEEYKHFIYIAALLIGLAVVLSILLKEGPAEE